MGGAQDVIQRRFVRRAFEREQPFVELLDMFLAFFLEDLKETLVLLIAWFHCLDSYLLNVEQNRFNKLYRAKTPRAQRKIFFYFSELGVLCAFARVIV
jgi:hypothetical protein